MSNETDPPSAGLDSTESPPETTPIGPNSAPESGSPYFDGQLTITVPLKASHTWRENIISLVQNHGGGISREDAMLWLEITLLTSNQVGQTSTPTQLETQIESSAQNGNLKVFGARGLSEQKGKTLTYSYRGGY